MRGERRRPSALFSDPRFVTAVLALVVSATGGLSKYLLDKLDSLQHRADMVTQRADDLTSTAEDLRSRVATATQRAAKLRAELARLDAQARADNATLTGQVSDARKVARAASKRPAQRVVVHEKAPPPAVTSQPSAPAPTPKSKPLLPPLF